MQRRQASVNVGEQLLVDGDRDVVLEQRCLQRRPEVADAHLEQVRLHRRRQRRAHGALVGLERAEERGEHLVAVGAVAVLPVQGERRRVQAHRLAGRQLDGRIRQVGVGQDAVHLAPGALHLAGLGGDLLLGGAQRVRLAPQRLLEKDAVGTELGLVGDELVHARRVHRQDLRPHPRAGRAERGRQLLRALLHLARARLAHVLVGQAVGVDHEPRQVPVEVEHQLQPRQQLLGRLAEMPAMLGRARAAASGSLPWPRSTPPPTDRDPPGSTCTCPGCPRVAWPLSLLSSCR